MDYKQAIKQIIERRNKDLSQAHALFISLMRNNEVFRNAELDFRRAELDFLHGKTSQEDLDKKRKTRDDVVARLAVKDKLNPPFRCEICHDTGRTKNGICACAKQLAHESKNDFSQFPLLTFDDFDITIYPSEVHQLVLKTAAELKTIALKGSTSKRKNINLIGAPGTGKTFLATCFANDCAEKGKSVVMLTAFSFVDRALKYHTTFDDNKAEYLAPLLETDVLVIDDLGTESIFKNVTLEYLYHIINERQLKGLTTVITSNLSVDAIAKRYGERIASRLFDKKLCYTREFTFSDIRKINVNN